MPKYRVYRVQEFIAVHKWLYVAEADSEEEAIEKATNDAAELVEQGTICQPEYAVWGWSARPVKPRDDDAGWNEAIATLEANRREYW